MNENELNEAIGRLHKYISAYIKHRARVNAIELAEAIKTELKAAYNEGQKDAQINSAVVGTFWESTYSGE